MHIVDENSPKVELRNHTRSEGFATAGANDFVRRLVTTIKPRLIVENRPDSGFTLPLAQGLNHNGFGKLVVFTTHAEKSAVLKKEIAAAGFTQSVSIDIRLESALDAAFEDTIDMLLCSADHEAVLRHLLPKINPVGLILLHAKENEFQQVNEIALRLESEGIISAVGLPGSNRLVMAQKRAGRK